MRYAGKEPILLNEQSTIVGVKLALSLFLLLLLEINLVSFCRELENCRRLMCLFRKVTNAFISRGVVKLHPGDLIGVAAGRLLRVPFDALPSPAPTPSPAAAPPISQPTSSCQMHPVAGNIPNIPARPKTPPAELLDRLNAAQRQRFDRLWSLPPPRHYLRPP